MKISRYWVVAAVFVALLILGSTQSAWAGPDLQTVPTFTPTPPPLETEIPHVLIDEPAGTIVNLGTYSAGALGCVGCTVSVTLVQNITSLPNSNYDLLQTPVAVVASSPNAQVVACFPISLAKYPNAQVWMYDPASSLWTVAPVFISDSGMLCGYAFGSGVFAPLTP